MVRRWPTLLFMLSLLVLAACEEPSVAPAIDSRSNLLTAAAAARLVRLGHCRHEMTFLLRFASANRAIARDRESHRIVRKLAALGITNTSRMAGAPLLVIRAMGGKLAAVVAITGVTGLYELDEDIVPDKTTPVAVLIDLAVADVDAEADETAQAAARRSIEIAQKEVASALAPVQPDELVFYANIGVIAATLRPAQLRKLARHPAICRIQPDQQNRPLRGNRQD